MRVDPEDTIASFNIEDFLISGFLQTLMSLETVSEVLLFELTHNTLYIHSLHPSKEVFHITKYAIHSLSSLFTSIHKRVKFSKLNTLKQVLKACTGGGIRVEFHRKGINFVNRDNIIIKMEDEEELISIEERRYEESLGGGSSICGTFETWVQPYFRIQASEIHRVIKELSIVSDKSLVNITLCQEGSLLTFEGEGEIAKLRFSYKNSARQQMSRTSQLNTLGPNQSQTGVYILSYLKIGTESATNNSTQMINLSISSSGALLLWYDISSKQKFWMCFANHLEVVS